MFMGSILSNVDNRGSSSSEVLIHKLNNECHDMVGLIP